MSRRLIGLSVVMLFVGCGGDNHTPTSPPTNVSDGSNTPNPHTTPVSGATATWSTSDTAVATVTTDGVVTSVGKGIAVIRASAPGEVIWFHPNPNSRPPFQRLSLGSGETFQIPISVIPTPSPLPLVVVAASMMTSTAGSWSSISSNPASSFGGLGMSSVTSCGINTDGDGYCWGDNSRGQLGDPVFSSATIFNCSSGNPYFPVCNRFESHLHVPLLVSGGHTWSSISGAGKTSCGVTTDGDGYCWGRVLGQPGIPPGIGANSYQPALVSGGHTWSSISASTTSCGVTTDGDGYCWGEGSSGQLGNGSSGWDNRSLNPVLVSGGHTWSSISAGWSSCGVTTDGDGYCWGDGSSGQLGTGGYFGPWITDIESPVPVLVKGGHTWASISTQGFTTCGVTTDGDGYCWGRNQYGQLGTGSTNEGADSGYPVLVNGGHTWVSISRGFSTTCGVTTAGEGYCWGLNIMTPTAVNSAPVLVDGGHTWAAINPGGMATCGVTTDGEGYCWGDNQQGGLGSGSPSERIGVPVRVITPWVE
jgi:alpha-tubulin suppressor-like RCC1 family protein